MATQCENGTKKRTIRKDKRLKTVNDRYKPTEPPRLPNCGHNNKRFKCATITMRDVKAFREGFYHEQSRTYQDNFMLKYIKTTTVKRHRVKKLAPVERTSKYFIENNKRIPVPVCVSAFIRVLNVSRFRINLLTKKNYLTGCIKDLRGGFPPVKRKEFEDKTASIAEFLQSLPCTESHYCGGETEKRYLPSELNITKLYRMYIDQVESEEFKAVKESYFRHIFKTKFNFGFGSSTNDVCSTCLSYQEKIETKNDGEHTLFHIIRLMNEDYLEACVEEQPSDFRQNQQTEFEDETASIVQFLKSLSCTESHYCRGQTEKLYLPSELDISKLHQMYIEQVESDELKAVKEGYFRNVFNTKFNFGFGSPRTDDCSTCLSYQEKIKTEKDEEEKETLRVSYTIHKKRAESFFNFLRPSLQKDDESEILDDNLILSFACQKNLPLLKVPDSAVYYSRNAYLYNFTIVQGYSTDQLKRSNVTAYCWTENEYPKNSNTIASCLLYHLEHTDLERYKHITLVADGCAVQNRNSIVVTALLQWLSRSAPKNIMDIKLVFPVTGHSHIPPDRVFAQIERKCRKRDTITDPTEYLHIINKCAIVKRIGTDVPVLDVKKAMNVILKPCASWCFAISQVKRLVLTSTESSITMRGELFYEHDIAIPFDSYCKPGKRLSSLEFDEVEETNNISQEKKADLGNLLQKHFGDDWRSIPTLAFFVYLLDVAISVVSDENEDENVDPDDPEPCSSVQEQPDLIV